MDDTSRTSTMDVIKLLLSAAGVFILVLQLDSVYENLKILRQNQIEEKKPHGVVHSEMDYYTSEGITKVRKIVVDTANCKIDEFTIRFRPDFVNKGRDDLIFIGGIAMYSTDTLDFRQKIFEKSDVLKFPNLKYGNTVNLFRGNTLSTDAMVSESYTWYGVRHAPAIYIYTIYYYRDLLGNLFDTQHIVYLKLEDSDYKSGRLDVQINDVQYKTTFWSYNYVDRRKIRDFFHNSPEDDLNARSMLSMIAEH